MNAPRALTTDVSVSVDSAVYHRISSRVAAEAGKRETGGLLLGLRAKGAIRIMRCTFPGPADLSTHHRFHRRCPSHQISATMWWVRCGGKGDWVGEWHSHPEADPTPSNIDIDSWKRQVAHVQKPLTFMIFGLSSVYGATISPGSNTIDPLDIVEATRPWIS
ncbi:Mov34/MPN/PAD-1 family protein [Maricaulis sp. CAU 1757]